MEASLSALVKSIYYTHVYFGGNKLHFLFAFHFILLHGI